MLDIYSMSLYIKKKKKKKLGVVLLVWSLSFPEKALRAVRAGGEGYRDKLCVSKQILPYCHE